MSESFNKPVLNSFARCRSVMKCMRTRHGKKNSHRCCFYEKIFCLTEVEKPEKTMKKLLLLAPFGFAGFKRYSHSVAAAKVKNFERS